MNETTLVGENTVATHESITGNRLTEDLNSQNISDNFLSFLLCKLYRIITYTIEIGVQESNVVVTSNEIAQRRKTFVNTLNNDFIRKRITDVL